MEDVIGVFVTSFSLIFITEIADKSRVAGVLLATTYRAPGKIFWGMTLAYALLEAIAVTVGAAIPFLYSGSWLRFAVAFMFIALGIASFFIPEESQEQARQWLNKIEKFGPFLVSFMAIAVSELGDRTQIACAGLAAQSQQPVQVFAGALSALALLNLFTVWFGKVLSERLPFSVLKKIGGILFIFFGIAILL